LSWSTVSSREKPMTLMRRYLPWMGLLLAGGAIGIELPGLLGLLVLASTGKQQSRCRADQRADQMRLRYDGRA